MPRQATKNVPNKERSYGNIQKHILHPTWSDGKPMTWKWLPFWILLEHHQKKAIGYKIRVHSTPYPEILETNYYVLLFFPEM